MNRFSFAFLFVAVSVAVLTSCATFTVHQFIGPARDWQTRSGQLMYRSAKRTLIGEVLVRYSNRSDFELTFSKGSGLTLFTLRQDTNFAQVTGALAGRGWSGPIDRAPSQLRGWLQLHDKIIQAQGQQSIRYTTGTETFLFHF